MRSTLNRCRLFLFLYRLHSYGEGELNFKKSFVYVAFANTISQV